LRALELKRSEVAAYAQQFSWRAATEQFVSHLHPRVDAPMRNVRDAVMAQNA
jgi:hypothetical protein